MEILSHHIQISSKDLEKFLLNYLQEIALENKVKLELDSLTEERESSHSNWLDIVYGGCEQANVQS